LLYINLAVRFYTDKDADLRWLKGKTCAVIGFVAQGHAHALNFRDSRMEAKLKRARLEKFGARLRSLTSWKQKS